MALSEDPKVSEVIEHLDFRHACIRCGAPFAEISAVITPWTVTLPRDGTGCIGFYVTFLCLGCRERSGDSAAADIVRLLSVAQTMSSFPMPRHSGNAVSTV